MWEADYSAPDGFHSNSRNCTPPADGQFPSGLFSLEERQDGAITIHILVTIYMFVTMAIICHHYFVPAIERFAEVCKVSHNVAGASLMATGASIPQLCITIIGSFIAQDDIGVGSVVGASFFNVLFIPAVCGFAVSGTIMLEFWPVVRDCVAFLTAGIILTLVIEDKQIYWYESMAMILTYFLYILVLVMNPMLEEWARKVASSCTVTCPQGSCCKEKESNENVFFANAEITQSSTKNYESLPDSRASSAEVAVEHEENWAVTIAAEQSGQKDTDAIIPTTEENAIKDISEVKEDEGQNKDLEDAEVIFPVDSMSFGKTKSLLARPEGALHWIGYIIMFPILLLLTMFIPDFRRPGCWRHLLWLTLFMSVVFIGLSSYVLIWMISIIGDTFGAPSTVMGMTILAAGGSLPDLLNSVFAARDGYGDMALANTLGSNLFDMLFCLGFPWLINFLFVNGRGPVPIDEDLDVVAICLISTAVVAFLALFINRWMINKKVAVFFLIAYLAYIISCSIYEFYHSLPPCK